MLFAWLQLGSNGIIHARYTRDLYGERTWCGVKVWFQAHRMNMALCYCFTAIGFVIIFVESKKISVVSFHAWQLFNLDPGFLFIDQVLINDS